MKTKKRLVAITFILFVFLAMSVSLVKSECPKLVYTPDDLRAHLREIVLGFLSDPSSSPYTINEILDLLNFYKNEKSKSLIDNCDVKTDPSLSNEEISAIMAKTIEFVTECNDKIDNDGDGAIDLDDAGCTYLNDNDETNCGDNICEGAESCSSCSLDCGACPVPAINILAMKGISNTISFNDHGDIILKGMLKQNAMPVLTSDDEFIAKDKAGNPVAVVNLATGNMVIKGSLFENQPSLIPSRASNDFIVKDTNGNVVSYMDESGNLYLKGLLVENGNP